MFTIRDLQNYEEMWAVHKLQQEIWGQADPSLGLYPPVLNTAAKNGGVVLGAFDNETGRMVAFLFSFLGREPGGPLKLCSQTMGVLKQWRKQGIAEALKQTQRRRAIAQDLPLITWTYDPLEGPNAHLNLHKLRAVSRRYLRDVYGSNFGALNAGLPTDRLLVEWWVNGPRLDEPYQPPVSLGAPVFEIAGQEIERRIVKSNLDLEETVLHLEIVADLHPLKAANMALAFDWRLKVREAFEVYFARGYIATDFISTGEQDERHNRYILQKSTPTLFSEIGMAETS
jgi:predicted GNAT superfamily acetyltransferase